MHQDTERRRSNASAAHASRLIRHRLLAREEGIVPVRQHDPELDDQALRDFCEFAGSTGSEFWAIVARQHNRNLS